jgi:hypothetical protein
VALFFTSILIPKLLAPLEYIRRFTLWWFKDIDAHPLRAIAKVAATFDRDRCIRPKGGALGMVAGLVR